MVEVGEAYAAAVVIIAVGIDIECLVKTEFVLKVDAAFASWNTAKQGVFIAVLLACSQQYNGGEQ